LTFWTPGAAPPELPRAMEALGTGRLRWEVGPPLVAPAVRADDPCVSVKDPTIVQYAGRWHLFCTIRSRVRSHQIEYLSFADWGQANAAPRHVLTITNGYFCAPQVFYFTPHRKWYLVFQIADPTGKPRLQPAYATTDDVGNPQSWSKPTLLFDRHPENVKGWIDFWVICDNEHAHLFFTSLDGRMWRAQSSRQDFPHGWSIPTVVLTADIFEASHTYKLKGYDRYLTLVEAQRSGRRYYKAYLASSLAGTWQPLADTHERPFASPVNAVDRAEHWTDSFSHGELLRAGYDEYLEVDPDRLRFLFQGVSDADKAGKKYGEIPWRLGILEPIP
jgi:hypothetical protein